MRTRLTNCELIDPSRGERFWGYVEWEDGLIRETGHAGPGLDQPKGGSAARVIDGRGHLLAPSFVDLLADFGEPGFEYREDMATGSAAAASGGYTTVCLSPDTDPTCDGADTARFMLDKAAEAGLADILPTGALTVGNLGESMSDMHDLSELGVRAVSSGCGYVADSGLLRHAMEYAGTFGLTVFLGSEDPHLVEGPVHEGMVSAFTGLGATPAAAEEIAVARHIALCGLTGTAIHLLKLSSEAGVRLVRDAKARGVPVTASVTAHHLVLNEDSTATYDTASKVRPPLRSEEDRRALLEGVKDGTIDAITSDHSPRSVEEKDVEFDIAAHGASGIELTYALLNRLVLSGDLGLPQVLGALAVGPRRVLGIGDGSLESGEPADMVLIDRELSWTPSRATIESKSANTVVTEPLTGRPVMTFRRGEVTFNRLS